MADERAKTKTFGFEATVTDPPSLTREEQQALRRRFEKVGITKLRLHEDTDGRTALSFPVGARNDREALGKGRDVALSALADHPVAWMVGGITHWIDE